MSRRDPLAEPEPLIRRVYAYVAYQIGDGADAEDVTSSTFERALRYRARFDPARGDVSAWLIGIARREISELFARRPLPIADVPEESAPGDLEGEALTRLELRRAVSMLGERDRELIALRFGADLTARQIGDVLSLRTNAVEVALHRALQTLRGALERPAPDAGDAFRPNLRAAE